MSNKDQWECDFCHNKKLMESRNCGGSYKKVMVKVFDRIFEQCPLSSLDRDSIELYNIIMLCEGGGMGGSRVMPSVMLEETNFYFNARQAIFAEKNRVEDYQKKKERK